MKRIAILQLALLTGCSNAWAQKPASKPVVVDESYLYAASFSPDGKRIATGSDEGWVTVWDVASGKRLWSTRFHDAEILTRIATVKFSPDGKQIASGAADSTLRLLDAATGKQIRAFKGHQGEIESVSFSPDGKQLVSGDWDNGREGLGALKVWSVASGKLVRTLGSHQETLCVDFSPNGQQIVSAGSDVYPKKNGIWVWSAKTGQLLRTFNARQTVSYVGFSRDSKQILSNSSNPVDASDRPTKQPLSGFRLWNAATGYPLHTFTTKPGTGALAFSPDGKSIASCGGGKTGGGASVRLWNARTGKQIRFLTGKNNRPLTEDDILPVFLGFSPNGKQILGGGGDSQLKLWSAATGKLMRTFGKSTE